MESYTDILDLLMEAARTILLNMGQNASCLINNFASLNPNLLRLVYPPFSNGTWLNHIIECIEL